jgi:hypothetical protein
MRATIRSLRNAFWGVVKSREYNVCFNMTNYQLMMRSLPLFSLKRAVKLRNFSSLLIVKRARQSRMHMQHQSRALCTLFKCLLISA